MMKKSNINDEEKKGLRFFEVLSAIASCGFAVVGIFKEGNYWPLVVLCLAISLFCNYIGDFKE